MRSGYQANKAFTRLAVPASREEEEVVRRRRRKSWLQIQLIVINETKKKKSSQGGGKPENEVAIISYSMCASKGALALPQTHE